MWSFEENSKHSLSPEGMTIFVEKTEFCLTPAVNLDNFVDQVNNGIEKQILAFRGKYSLQNFIIGYMDVNYICMRDIKWHQCSGYIWLWALLHAKGNRKRKSKQDGIEIALLIVQLPIR